MLLKSVGLVFLEIFITLNSYVPLYVDVSKQVSSRTLFYQIAKKHKIKDYSCVLISKEEIGL